MGAITRGQADWSKVNGYEYSKLIETVLLVMEVAARRMAAHRDFEL